MSSQSALRHPASGLAVFLAVPLVANLLTLLNTPRIFPTEKFFVLPGSGALMVIAWGPAAVLFCAFLGVLVGLPLAGFQSAYLRYRLRLAARGMDLREALSPNPLLVGVTPWLVTCALAFVVGWAWLFPPVGGYLLAVNVLWARTLVYPSAALAWEYLRADEELRAEAEAAPFATAG